MAKIFPYGNDLAKPEHWAGLSNTKSRTWLVAYHSGFSFFLGQHTMLFFGKENLCAAVVSLTGAGLQAGFSASRARRGGGVTKLPKPKIPESKPSKKIEQRLDAFDKTREFNDYVESGDDVASLDSAQKLYKAIFPNAQEIIANIPFSVSDLEGKNGAITGVSAEAAIGSAKFYFLNAKTDGEEFYFKDKQIFNISGDPTLVGAQIGVMAGFFSVKKTYSLFHELSNSDSKQTPFDQYAVHEFFRTYKSRMYKNKKIQMQLNCLTQNKLICGQIQKNMEFLVT